MMQVGCPYDTTSRPSNKHITNGITNTYYRYTYIERWVDSYAMGKNGVHSSHLYESPWYLHHRLVDDVLRT